MALPKEKPQGLDKPIVASLIKYGAKGNVALFRLTNGRIGATWRIGAGWKKPVPVLLLDHVGRKSGKRFTTPLLYLPDGPRTVVVASQGGLPKNPQWFHNLLANPETTIHLPRERDRKVRARVADPVERAALWPRLVDLYADFDNYQSWTDREIPVVVLEPR
ncbi:nitroreductase family deazaflavin-dependent oxidoreductase [Nocardioides sp. zg-536]|uniref:Nitroreductase family deazaflavin-dependent oxidoreductase n=1 Tax=Nocardioides faecalis TaxID=2803858 RepID=A0A939BRE1_9ACTN|nr:nitroreductase family deazaflavin-dependent oxidoreductase [Nocardioides faecalis]MBM9458529.1 nitroreductase family deazaflavin-dependent oxidoreductase [Nocardioides faecalis]MBS4752860.1 nitroreductase family deazaflavin-dependent oxidoreductase [Nocardioides faecalis]QVI58533.1 nitroreductase family deazaflavin-dependent oxidoreductase [Nocardioides faecalis]